MSGVPVPVEHGQRANHLFFIDPHRAKTYLVNIDPVASPYNPLGFFSGKPNSFLTYLASSIFSGLCVCAVMQPADTALTRMYNQPVRIDGEHSF